LSTQKVVCSTLFNKELRALVNFSFSDCTKANANAYCLLPWYLLPKIGGGKSSRQQIHILNFKLQHFVTIKANQQKTRTVNCTPLTARLYDCIKWSSHRWPLGNQTNITADYFMHTMR